MEVLKFRSSKRFIAVNFVEFLRILGVSNFLFMTLTMLSLLSITFGSRLLKVGIGIVPTGEIGDLGVALAVWFVDAVLVLTRFDEGIFWISFGFLKAVAFRCSLFWFGCRLLAELRSLDLYFLFLLCAALVLIASLELVLFTVVIALTDAGDKPSFFSTSSSGTIILFFSFVFLSAPNFLDLLSPLKFCFRIASNMCIP
eukprot:NODE_508_length_7458_cov_0.132491.p6 type:complete len:199 gc:universal NODE_508_length_7458_cov_0.132491:6202-6798(+)